MLKLLPILILAASLAGCAYAPPIRQGNYLDQKTIAKVKVGMTRTQVKFVLGTPMLENPFESNRWDYVYYVQPNDGNPVQHQHVIVYFTGKTVSRITKPDVAPSSPAGTVD